MITKVHDADYNLFLPAVAAALRGKDKKDSQVSESEFRQIVAVTFRDSMIQFTQDSLLYRVELPIDVFKGVDRYDIIPPKGFIIEDVVHLKTNKIKVPSHSFTQSDIVLNCCPVKDVYSAFFVEVALSPTRVDAKCKFPLTFVERHYDAILSNMFQRLYGMVERTWRSLGSAELNKREYQRRLNKAKRTNFSGGAPIRLSSRLLSSASR